MLTWSNIGIMWTAVTTCFNICVEVAHRENRRNLQMRWFVHLLIEQIINCIFDWSRETKVIFSQHNNKTKASAALIVLLHFFAGILNLILVNSMSHVIVSLFRYNWIHVIPNIKYLKKMAIRVITWMWLNKKQVT